MSSSQTNQNNSSLQRMPTDDMSLPMVQQQREEQQMLDFLQQSYQSSGQLRPRSHSMGEQPDVQQMQQQLPAKPRPRSHSTAEQQQHAHRQQQQQLLLNRVVQHEPVKQELDNGQQCLTSHGLNFAENNLAAKAVRPSSNIVYPTSQIQLPLLQSEHAETDKQCQHYHEEPPQRHQEQAQQQQQTSTTAPSTSMTAITTAPITPPPQQQPQPLPQQQPTMMMKASANQQLQQQQQHPQQQQTALIMPVPPTLNLEQFQQLQDRQAKMMMMTIVNPSSNTDGTSQLGNTHSQLVFYLPQLKQQQRTQLATTLDAGNGRGDTCENQLSTHNNSKSSEVDSSQTSQQVSYQQPRGHHKPVEEHHHNHQQQQQLLGNSTNHSIHNPNLPTPAGGNSYSSYILNQQQHAPLSIKSALEPLQQAQTISNSMSSLSTWEPSECVDFADSEKCIKSVNSFTTLKKGYENLNLATTRPSNVSPTSKATTAPAKNDESTIVRPLSAYNFFFSEERERLLHGKNLSNGSYDQRKQRLLSQHLTKDRTTRRPHRKTHGKINFTSLSKLIGQRWRQLPEAEKGFYRQVAAADLRRYQEQLAISNSREAKKDSLY